MDFPPDIRGGSPASTRDPRGPKILAKTIYRELRQSGLAEEEVMSLAGELLSLVATEMKDRRRDAPKSPGAALGRAAEPVEPLVAR
jgi:hypothetical protein